MDKTAKQMMEGINDTLALMADANAGILDDSGELTLNLRGDEPAEALGHAYHIRDVLRDNGYESEAEYIGEADEQPEWSSQDRHVIEVRWSSDE